MNKHQQTPDILSEILGGGVKPAAENAVPPVEPKTPAVRVPARRQSKSKLVSNSESQEKEKLLPKSQSRISGKNTVAIKEYEYSLVTFQDHKGWRVRFINGIQVSNWSDGELIHQCLQRMGKEGWELVSACAGERMYGSGDKYQLYFKRPSD